MNEINFNKIEKYNATVNAVKPETVVGQNFIIDGIFQYEDDVINSETRTTEKKIITVIKTNENILISSQSETLRNSVDMAVSIFSDELVGMSAKIEARKSNSGRTFYILALVG